MGTGTDPDSLPPVRNYRTEHDWIVCRVEEDTFKAAGGPENLGELPAYFLKRVSP